MPEPSRENKFNFLSGTEIFSGITLAELIGAAYSLPDYSRITMDEFGSRLRLKEKKSTIMIIRDKRKLKDPDKRLTLGAIREILNEASANKVIMFSKNVLHQVEVTDDRVRLRF